VTLGILLSTSFEQSNGNRYLLCKGLAKNLGKTW